MRRKLALLSLLAIPFLGESQMVVMGGSSKQKLKDPETSIGTIYYDFSYISDTTQPERPTKEIMALSFSNDYSKFYSETYHRTDSLSRAEMNQQLKAQQGSANLTFNVTAPEGSKDQFLANSKDNLLAEEKRIAMNAYLIQTNNSTIDWQIEDSTKMIGGYNCQKAIGISFGRQYTAWFTTDLPYGFGPRRLWGLPGLILEAADSKERIVYHFKSYTPNTSETLGIPENAIVATQKEFDEMQKAFKANPSAFFNSGSTTNVPYTGNEKSGGSLNIKSMTINKKASSTSKGLKKLEMNYPIDLSK